MKESGITRLFILVCVAVLLGAYGVGLGVRKIRFAGVETKASAAAQTNKPTAKSDSDNEQVTAKKAAAPEPSDEVAAEPAQQTDERPGPRPERAEGRRMGGAGMRERFQNMSEEERREAMAQMRERLGGRTRGEGGGRGGAFSQMSEEDRDNFRAEMEALNDRADEMSEDEMLFEKYGITPRGGPGGRRGGSRE